MDVIFVMCPTQWRVILPLAWYFKLNANEIRLVSNETEM